MSFSKASLLLWILFFVCIVLIAYLSSQDGSATKNTSLYLSEKLACLFFPNSGPERVIEIDYYIRKIAHVGLFFLLGGFLFCACYFTFSPVTFKHHAIIAVLTSLTLAFLGFVDEWRKQFIDGRHFDLSEVALNIVGALSAVLLCLVAVFIRLSIKSHG